MKLNQLLKQITPLPWSVSQPARSDGCDAAHAGINGSLIDVWRFGDHPENYRHLVDAEAAYLVHAANQLPQLIEALKSFLRAPSTGSDGPNSVTIVVQEFNLANARKAIAAAESVDNIPHSSLLTLTLTPNSQLPTPNS